MLHPQDLGHRIMADLAVWLFQQTALDLLIRPYGEEDQELIDEGLPLPMYPGEFFCLRVKKMVPFI